ncbi:MAG: leucine-rich repeat protein [Coprobacter sp.]|nr:leucine-rich repeat protein [Coprobacter sp.]
MKKIRITLFMMFLIITSSFAYDFEVDGIYYTILSDKVSVAVSKKSNVYYTGSIIIPGTVEFGGIVYDVTEIGEDAFYKSTITDIVLPESLKIIRNFAFGYSSQLQECIIPDNVSVITQNAFYRCISLSYVKLPAKLNTLESSVFYGCESLEEITIPSSVVSIEYSRLTTPKETTHSPCFYSCTNLKKVIFEDGDLPITFIDVDSGFSGYSSSLYANGIFYLCPLEYIYLGRTLNNTTNKSLFQDFTTLKTVEIGPKVISLQNYAFRNCKNLENLIIPSSVTSIASYAFENCENLENLIIPSSVTSIGSYMCSGSGIKELYIGNGINTIPSNICSGCKNLKNIYLGNAISSIGSSAFNSCTNLTNVYLFSDNLTTIGTNAIPTTVSKIYVPNPSRYDNLLKDYYRDYLIGVNPSSSEYSGKAPNFSYTNNVEGSMVSFDSPDLNINAGEYNTNVDVTFTIGEWQSTVKVPASYTIASAPLTVIANDATRQYGEDNPELTCSFFGFKNGETKDVLTTQPTIETTATATSNVGTYPIIPYGAEAQNYTFTYERGSLSIIKANQEITWNQSFNDVQVGDIIELTAESTSGLAIKYTSTDETTAEIFTQNGKKCVEFLKAGTVSIRANQEGNENYNEADRISKTITVNAPTGIDSVKIDMNETFDIYNVNGILMYKAATKEMLNTLTSGLYIIHQNGVIHKLAIK